MYQIYKFDTNKIYPTNINKFHPSLKIKKKKDIGVKIFTYIISISNNLFKLYIITI